MRRHPLWTASIRSPIAHTHTHTHIYIYIHVYVYECMRWVPVRIYGSVSVYIYACMFVLMFVCIISCVCVFLRIYTGKFLLTSYFWNRLRPQFPSSYRTGTVISRSVCELCRSNPELCNSDWFPCHESAGKTCPSHRMIAQHFKDFRLRTY